MMWRPKGQGPKTPQRGSSDEEAQTTTPRRRGRSDSREAAAEADAALEDSEVEEGATPTGAAADRTPRSASKRRLSLPMLLKRLSSPPPLGRRRRRPASQGGGEEEGLESEPEQHQQQEGQAEAGPPGVVAGDEPADDGREGVDPAPETAAAVTTSGEAAAAAGPLAAAAEGIDAAAGQQEGKLTVVVEQRVEEEDEPDEEQPDPEAADALRSVPASPFPAPITPSQLGKARRAATDELRQTLAAHMGAPLPVLATPVRELEVEEHDGGPSSLRSGRSGAASSTVAVAGDGSVASPLSLGEAEEQASQVTGTGTSPLSPASSARRPAHALRGRGGQDGSLLSFPSTGGAGAGTPGRRGIGGGGGGARLLSRESMLQAELYRARKQLEEERAKAQAAVAQEQRWRAESEAREAAASQAQALQEVVARWGATYWRRLREQPDGGDDADVALARAVAQELPALLDAEQARLFVVGAGRLWTVGPGTAAAGAAAASVVEAPLGTGLVGQAAATGAAVVSEDGCMACVPVALCPPAGGASATYAVLQCTRDEAAHGARPFQRRQQEDDPLAPLRSLARQLAPMLAGGRQATALRAARARALMRVVAAVARRKKAAALTRWAEASGVGGARASFTALAMSGGGGLTGGLEVLAEALSIMEALAPSGQQYLLLEAVEKAARELLEGHGVGVAGVWAGVQDLLPEEVLALGPVGGAADAGVVDVPFTFLHCAGGGGSSSCLLLGEEGDADEEGADASYTWERAHGVLRVKLLGATVVGDELRRLLGLLVQGAAGWLSGLVVPRLARRARELGAEGAISRREAVQLRGEAIKLHDQVYRQQAELNAVGARLEAAEGRAHAGTAVLEAAERLLASAWGWEGLRDALPAAASLLLRFDRLEYRFRASAPLLTPAALVGEADGVSDAASGMMHVLEVVDVASSAEARHTGVLSQVMASGAAALSQLRSSDHSASINTTTTTTTTPCPVASLCLPLTLGGATVGALLLERRGGQAPSSSGEGFSEEEVARATRLAGVVAGVMRRLAREQVREDRLRRAGGAAGQRTGRLLAAAERLWAKAGAVEEVYAEFEHAVAALLLPVAAEAVGGPPQALCTLFLADAHHGLLRAANGESVPLGVGALGAAAAAGRPLWEGRHSLYVPVVVPDDGVVLAVARILFSRSAFEGAAEHAVPAPPSEDGVAEEEQEEVLRAVEALSRILLPVLQHSQALQTAFGGMRDASDALESLSGRLAAAREEAAAEATGRMRAEEVVAALQRLHVDCSRGPDALVALFRAAETAACLATGADAAALLLVVDEEKGPGAAGGGGGENGAAGMVGRPPELWTLWPVEMGQGQERGRLRIPQESAPAEVHAVMQGAALAISSGGHAEQHTLLHPQQHQHQHMGAGAFTPFQSWLFGHVEVERGAASAGDEGDGGALLPESTVLMVPVPQLSGGVAGVLEVVKRGRLDGQEEAALAVLARALSTVVAWFQAQLQLARARGEEAALRQALLEQAKAADGADVGARQAGVLANLAFDLLAAPDRPTALALAEAHLQEAMGAHAVRLRPQQPFPVASLSASAARFAESSAGGAEGLEVSLGVRKGRLECEVTGVEGRVLGTVVVDGPGMAFEAGAELDEEEIQLLVARAWVMLERALVGLARREATVAAAGGWERLSRRLLDMVCLAARGLGPGVAALCPPPSAEELDPAGPAMQAQAAALCPHVRLAEEAAMDLLGADAARLYLVGRERALSVVLAGLGAGAGSPASVAGPCDPAAVPLELWALLSGVAHDDTAAAASSWCLEKQQPLQQARGQAAAAVWDHLRRWLPLLGYAEDAQGRLLLRQPAGSLVMGDMGEPDPNLAMDIRWPHGGAADAHRGRQAAPLPVMSVPIFLPPPPPQQTHQQQPSPPPVPLSEALVGVLVVERGAPGEDPSARPAFSRGEAALAAQWSLRLAELLGGLVREGFLRSHALARRRAAALARLGRRLAAARARQAFQRWWRNTREDARDRAIAAQTEAAAAGSAQARVLRLLAACVECVGGLAPVAAEEEDTEVLLSELEQLVAQLLPAALPAERCTLTLLRPGEERKLKPSEGGGSSSSSSSRARDKEGGGILLSKPVLTPGGDLVGLLEAALGGDDEVEVRAIEAADRALALAGKLLGGLAALLRELGAAREEKGDAAHLAKVLESQARLYREAAEAAVRGEALATDAGAFLLHKSDLAAAFLPAAHDLGALGRVVSEQLPPLLAPATGDAAAAAASATLLLPSRLCSPSGRQDDKGVQFAPAFEAAAADEGPHAALVAGKTPELLERCRVTRRRVVRILKEAGGARLLCDPVLDAEDGTVWAVLRVVLPPAAGDERAEAEARDKVLGWASGVLATAVEGARRVEALREKAALDHWLAVRYRRLAEFGRLLRLRTGDEEAAVLAWVVEQAGPVLGAERAAVFLREAGGLSVVKGDGEGVRRLGPEAAATVTKSAVGQLLRAAAGGGVSGAQRRVWGLPRTALLAYDERVDVAVGRAEVLGMVELEGPAGVVQAAWDPTRLPAGALDAARPLAKEMARQVAAALAALRGHHHTVPGLPAASSAGKPLGLRLAEEVLPRLLAAPLREPRIQAVMRSVSQQGESLLRASLAARLGPSSSSSLDVSVTLDLFALDQEGLWTLARPHGPPGGVAEEEQERILTVPAAARGVLAQAAREQRLLVRQYQQANEEEEEGDLVGDVAASPAAVAAVAAFPVLSPATAAASAGGSESPSAGGNRLRGVLRCVVRCPSATEGGTPTLLSREEEALLVALAHAAAASVMVLDSAAASQAFGELYDRASGALALAQGNVLRSRERAERLQGLCACALMAALPLAWEPAAGSTAAVASSGMGQVARVARAALQGCQALFGCRRAALLLVVARGDDGNAQQPQRSLDVFEAAAAASEGEGEEDASIRRAQAPWPRGGLLGRCLRKGQALNVPGRGGKEKKGHGIHQQQLQRHFDPAVDGPDPAAPTLLLPLRGPGNAVLGVLRLWRHAAAPFTRDEEIMAEVYASHLATALSYAQALDGAGDGTAASPSLPTPAGAVVSAPLSVGALAARAGSCTPSLLSVLGPSEALGTGGMASVRSSSSALRTGGPLSSMRALAPLSSAAGGHRDADASFFGAEAAPHMHPQSQLEEIKRQLQDIHRSTRRALSDMQQDGPTPATAAAAAGGVYTPAAAGGTGLLNTSASGFLGGGAGDVSLLDAPPSVASAGPARSVRGKGGSAMNRSLDALAARHHRNHLHQQAGDGGGGGDESILSAPPAVAAAAGAASSTASAAASAAGAAAGVSSTADLGERIRSMKAENQRLSQTLNVFLAREAVAGVRRND